jgi:DNA polymerase-3 subunit alpha
MVAVINNFGGFYSNELYFSEQRKTGAAIHLPDVNESEYFTSIKGNDVYTGFVHIKSLQQEMAEKIIRERKRAGSYMHLQDFIERTDCTKEQLNMLISIGAFRFTGKSKKKLLWEANFLQKKNKVHAGVGAMMFEKEPVHFALPELPDNRLDDLYDETELLDFPMCNPFEMVDDNGHAYTKAKELQKNCGKVVTVLGYFIDHKRVTTVKGEIMAFCTFLDVNLDWIDTVHFPDSLRYYDLKGKGFYKITGKVVDDFGVYSIEVNKMEKVGYKARKYADL